MAAGFFGESAAVVFDFWELGVWFFGNLGDWGYICF
jgi:hypothetical protein